jgi:hypothetical protein
LVYFIALTRSRKNFTCHVTTTLPLPAPFFLIVFVSASSLLSQLFFIRLTTFRRLSPVIALSPVTNLPPPCHLPSIGHADFSISLPPLIVRGLISCVSFSVFRVK